MKVYTSITVQGLLEDNRVDETTIATKPDRIINLFAGRKLSELKINCTLTSAEDLKDLMMFLDCTMPCFLPAPKERVRIPKRPNSDNI